MELELFPQQTEIQALTQHFTLILHLGAAVVAVAMQVLQAATAGQAAVVLVQALREEEVPVFLVKVIMALRVAGLHYIRAAGAVARP